MSATKWFLITNTENLKYYFDCNMIVERQAFTGNSYLCDIQSQRPKGYITICSQSNLSEALELAVSEDSNLDACIAEIELKLLSSNAVHVRNNHGLYELPSLGQIDDYDIDEILLPAPLPIGAIKNVILKDSKTSGRLKCEFERQFGEFPTKFFLNNSKLFNQKKQPITSAGFVSDMYVSGNNLQDISEITIDYQKAFAFGGALSLAYYQTKNGRLSCHLFKQLIDYDYGESNNKHLSALKCWATGSECLNDLDIFFNRILDITASEGDFGTIQHDLLNAFEHKEGIPEAYLKVSGLAKRLRQIVERTYEDDLDTYFAKLISHYENEEAGSSKPYLLISMVFIRDHIETALKFYHEDFSEEDYFLIATFYGLFRGIKRTPQVIRSVSGLREWVSHQMVSLLHRRTGDRLELIKGPGQPPLLFDKFIKDSINPKAQDNLQQFVSYIGLDEGDVLSWVLNTKDEYIVKGNAIKFSSRPKLTAQVDYENLERMMQIATIKDAKELFNFNKVLSIFK